MTCEENAFKTSQNLKQTTKHLSFAGELLTYFWSTSAHNYLLEKAFPELDDECIKRMQEGSEFVDTMQFQTEDLSFIHAMSSEVYAPDEAKIKMEEYIRDIYSRANRLGDDPHRQCFLRGAALHPVMDSSSPCHRGFQKWSPTNLTEVFKHNSINEHVHQIFGKDIGLPSFEDLKALKSKPKVLKSTIERMRKVDQENFVQE